MSQTSPVVIGLVQLTEPMSDFLNLPYAVGLLQAYVQAHAEKSSRYLFLLPIFKRDSIKSDRQRLSMAHIVGFSTYVWNMEYSLALAKAIKQHNPDTLIVFGGPQVPDQAEDFLREHPWIDVCVHGPGEVSFLELTEAYPQRNWGRIAGISYLEQGQFYTHPKAPVLKDLDLIPSPYLNGVMEPLLLANPDINWIAAWETNRGCPFSCTFCDWGSAVASKVNRFGIDRLRDEIAWFARYHIQALYCTDSNFGSLPRDLEIAQFLVDSKKTYGDPRIIFTQTAKNVTDRAYKVQRMLLESGLSHVATLSLQSITPAVLKAIKRDNISLETYHELQNRFRQDQFETYTDVLLGLPGETFESFVSGIGTMIAQGQHREMRIWNTFVLPNAEMNEPAYRAKYGIESVFIRMYSLLDEVKEPPDGIYEKQEMIIATDTMNRENWIRARVFGWLVQILYYSNALKIPMMLLHSFVGLNYEDILLAFMEDPLPPNTPILKHLRQFLFERAHEMAQGGPEYIMGLEPASQKQCWMPTDYFISLQLLYSPKYSDFYEECRLVLQNLRAKHSVSHVAAIDALDEGLAVSMALNRMQHPQGKQFQIKLRYNIWDCYQQILAGQTPILKPDLQQLTRRAINGDYEIESRPLASGFAV